MKRIFIIAMIIALSSCASKPKKHQPNPLQDAAPVSILVLPPTSDSMETEGDAAVLASSVYPLAENGYYVIPVANMLATFAENGVLSAQEMHDISLSKLREIFGADAILYLHIQDYGVDYKIINSTVKVKVKADLVDARTGQKLWSNSVNKVQEPDNSNSGLIGMLVGAVIDQISNTVGDAAYDLSKPAMYQLLNGNRMVNGKYRSDYLKQHSK